MKRRSFIQGVLALIGATVAAKALPEPKPRMLTDEFPNGINAYNSPPFGQRWVFDPNCDRTRVYYMNQFQVDPQYRMVGGDGSGRLFYISRPLDIPRVGYNLTDKGWEQHIS